MDFFLCQSEYTYGLVNIAKVSFLSGISIEFVSLGVFFILGGLLDLINNFPVAMLLILLGALILYRFGFPATFVVADYNGQSVSHPIWFIGPNIIREFVKLVNTTIAEISLKN